MTKDPVHWLAMNVRTLLKRMEYLESELSDMKKIKTNMNVSCPDASLVPSELLPRIVINIEDLVERHKVSFPNPAATEFIPVSSDNLGNTQTFVDIVPVDATPGAVAACGLISTSTATTTKPVISNGGCFTQDLLEAPGSGVPLSESAPRDTSDTSQSDSIDIREWSISRKAAEDLLEAVTRFELTHASEDRTARTDSFNNVLRKIHIVLTDEEVFECLHSMRECVSAAIDDDEGTCELPVEDFLAVVLKDVECIMKYRDE